MQTISEPSKSVTPSESTAAKTQILLATLRARFPVLAEFKSLKIKIHLDIRAALEGEGIANIRIARALAWHVGDSWYLQSLAKGGARYNLAGEVDGEVTEAQRTHAAKQLKERRKRKKPKSPQSQTSPEPSAPPVDTTPPDPVPTARPVLKLKPKAGTVTTATVTRKEAKP
ncbi:MAG: hypothetical protein IPK63_16275 [Candidatus Competibacteraceae bacterium]|nr:hypothetical protein [Candidatus Competibacteraceae bacterium]